MQRKSKELRGDDVNSSSRNEASSLLQALSSTPISLTLSPEAQAAAKRHQLHRLAAFSPRHAEELRKLQSAQAQSHHRRAILEWAAQISTRAEEKLRALRTTEGGEREVRRRADSYAERLIGEQPDQSGARPPALSHQPSPTEIFEWDPDQSRQPKGTTGGGQWVSKGGGDLLGNVIRRNAMVAELTDGFTPAIIQSNRLAGDLQIVTRLPQEIISAAAAGLRTGGKAVVNGSATAIKNVVTLGLSSSQLELIGVTKEDRDRGYDTAVTIATASGQVLIAVGTGGLAGVLSKGGTVARTASGALIAFDAAGNAVGTVQGAYDAIENGINLENGAKIAGGALGLGANFKAGRELSRAAAAARVEAFIAKCKRTPSRTKTAANQYEIAHTGPYNYRVHGGGTKVDIDGYRGTTILEAKHVSNLMYSAYVPGSQMGKLKRARIMAKTGNELRRMRVIIRSGETPFKSVEIITNTPESKALFQRLLKDYDIPGTVRIAI